MTWPEGTTYTALPGNSWWDHHPERTEKDFADPWLEPAPDISGQTIATDDSWMEECEKLNIW